MAHRCTVTFVNFNFSARAKFMNCLMERTPESCEKTKNDSAKKSPTMLAVALLDSSLAFMSQRCESSRY